MPTRLKRLPAEWLSARMATVLGSLVPHPDTQGKIRTGSDQADTLARRLADRSLRRSRSFVPAQYPTRSGTASAYLKHSARTVQRAHSCLARAVGPPRSGMNISTRSPRHAARVCHLGRRRSWTTTDETLSTASSAVGSRADCVDMARLLMSRLSAVLISAFSPPALKPPRCVGTPARSAPRPTTFRGRQNAGELDPGPPEK